MTDRNLTELEHLKRCSDLDRDYRNLRAREQGNDLVRRAADETRLTPTDEEAAVARRWFPKGPPALDIKPWPMTGDQAITGLHEPDLDRAPRKSRLAQCVLRARVWWLNFTNRTA